MKKIKSIYNLGKKVGLNNNDISYILKNTNTPIEQVSISTGPDYPGTWYGTVSIKDF